MTKPKKRRLPHHFDPQQQISRLKRRLAYRQDALARTTAEKSPAELEEYRDTIKEAEARGENTEVSRAHMEVLQSSMSRHTQKIGELNDKLAQALNANSKTDNIVERLRSYSDLSYFSMYHLTRNHVAPVQALLADYDSTINSQPINQQVQWLHEQLSTLDPKQDGTIHGILAECTALHTALNQHTAASAAPAAPTASHR